MARFRFSLSQFTSQVGAIQAFGGAFLVLLLIGCNGQKAATEHDQADDTFAMTPGIGRPSLMVGDQVTSISAAGWLNGPPPKLDDEDGPLILLDIWANW